MKKNLAVVFLLFWLLAGCGSVVPAETVVETTAAAVETTVEATVETVAAPVFSLPGVGVEDVIRYFNEVCLNAEIIHSGNPALLQKWEVPVCYMVHGQTTREDLDTLEGFVRWLNTVEGFPGIRETKEAWEANLDIYFCSQGELLERMGEQFVGMDGAVTFWYQEDAIYDAIICCRTDLSQRLRHSVILEEVYNGLGPIQDTQLRPDSIIAADYSEPQELTEMDRLILQLLYHPDMKCGMNAAECEAVIRGLYDSQTMK